MNYIVILGIGNLIIFVLGFIVLWSKIKKNIVSSNGKYEPIEINNLTTWAKAIKSRCGNKCYFCGKQYHLHAHHILPRRLYPDRELDENNGISVCNDCHLICETITRMLMKKLKMGSQSLLYDKEKHRKQKTIPSGLQQQIIDIYNKSKEDGSLKDLNIKSISASINSSRKFIYKTLYRFTDFKPRLAKNDITSKER